MKALSILIKKNKIIILFFFITSIFFSGCEKEKINPCSILVNGVFVYPAYPKDGWKSDDIWDEQRKYFSIPDNVLKCISTEGLIQSIINHPNYKVLLFAYSTWQQGFDRVSIECNGLSELVQRKDAISVLFKRYKEMNPLDFKKYSDSIESAKFQIDFWFIEIIMAQPVIFSKLTKDEKIVFFEFIIETYEKKIEADPLYGISWSKLNLGILARIMDNDNYQPFIKEYESCYLLENFVKTLFLTYNKDCNPKDIIYYYSKEYLETLKRTKK